MTTKDFLEDEIAMEQGRLADRQVGALAHALEDNPGMAEAFLKSAEVVAERIEGLADLHRRESELGE